MAGISRSWLRAMGDQAPASVIFSADSEVERDSTKDLLPLPWSQMRFRQSPRRKHPFRAAKPRETRKAAGEAFDVCFFPKPPRRRFGLRCCCHAEHLIELAFQFVVRFELAWVND